MGNTFVMLPHKKIKYSIYSLKISIAEKIKRKYIKIHFVNIYWKSAIFHFKT